MSLASPLKQNSDFFNFKPKKKSDFTFQKTINEALQIINSILQYNESNSSADENSIFDGEMPEVYVFRRESSGSLNSTDDENSVNISDNDLEDFEIFIKNWSKYFEFDENMLILFLMNLDKLLAKDFILNKKNYFKVVYICMMVTHKFYDDDTYKNKDYAKFIGVTVEELMEMEMEFLNIIDFDLFISEDEFENYKQKLSDFFSNNN